MSSGLAVKAFQEQVRFKQVAQKLALLWFRAVKGLGGPATGRISGRAFAKDPVYRQVLSTIKDLQVEDLLVRKQKLQDLATRQPDLLAFLLSASVALAENPDLRDVRDLSPDDEMRLFEVFRQQKNSPVDTLFEHLKQLRGEKAAIAGPETKRLLAPPLPPLDAPLPPLERPDTPPTPPVKKEPPVESKRHIMKTEIKVAGQPEKKRKPEAIESTGPYKNAIGSIFINFLNVKNQQENNEWFLDGLRLVLSQRAVKPEESAALGEILQSPLVKEFTRLLQEKAPVLFEAIRKDESAAKKKSGGILPSWLTSILGGKTGAAGEFATSDKIIQQTAFDIFKRMREFCMKNPKALNVVWRFGLNTENTYFARAVESLRQDAMRTLAAMDSCAYALLPTAAYRSLVEHLAGTAASAVHELADARAVLDAVSEWTVLQKPPADAKKHETFGAFSMWDAEAEKRVAALSPQDFKQAAARVAELMTAWLTNMQEKGILPKAEETAEIARLQATMEDAKVKALADLRHLSSSGQFNRPKDRMAFETDQKAFLEAVTRLHQTVVQYLRSEELFRLMDVFMQTVAIGRHQFESGDPEWHQQQANRAVWARIVGVLPRLVAPSDTVPGALPEQFLLELALAIRYKAPAHQQQILDCVQSSIKSHSALAAISHVVWRGEERHQTGIVTSSSNWLSIVKSDIRVDNVLESTRNALKLLEQLAKA